VNLKAIAIPFAALSLIGAAPATVPPADPAAVNRIRAHVQFLASDELEGRDTGSLSYRVAAQYVASQFSAIGLKPGGLNGSWFLEVPFRRATHAIAPKLSIIQGKRRTDLKIGVDAGIRPSLRRKDRKLDAGLVFAGRGISDPALRLNDYAGVDVRGKIAVVMAGSPAGIPSDVAAHLSTSKEQMAAAAGAIGLIELAVPGTLSSRPLRVKTKGPRIDLAPQGTATEENLVDVEVALTDSAAKRLFDKSGRTLEQMTDLARKGGKLPAFALSPRLSVEAKSAWEDFTSPQVIGYLLGADRRLSSEHIILMGHLDHIGIDADAKPGQDRINNGALDNASGIATMLEAARHFTSSGKPPRRSLMFVANTGEEKGLLGAQYLAAHPTVPANNIVGLVNLDMPLLLYDFTDVIAFGAEHSTMASIAATAAKSMKVKIAADPMPQQSLFVRSDHYRFVERGVPSIFLMTGYGNGGEAAWGRFLSTNYHKPSDDLAQPINWNAAARFAELNYRIARALADANQRPMWYAGDYFGNRFAPAQPKAAK
jgi:hypothetical protein